MTPKVQELSPNRFTPTPLLPWAIGMILGIALESRVPCSPLQCMIVILTCAVLTSVPQLRNKCALVFILLAATSFGALRHHLSMRTLDANHIANFAGEQRNLVKVFGTIAQPPRIYRTGYEPFAPWLHTTDHTLITIDTERIHAGGMEQPATGLLQISIAQPMLTAQDGDRIAAVGWLSALGTPRNPGQFNWTRFNARRGIRARLHCTRVENIEILHASRAHSRSLTSKFRTLLLGSGIATGDEGASLLDTMVLGHRSAVDEKIERLFLETGCAHYLAVSGVHIAMLASIVWFPARLLGANRQLAAALLIVSVLAYVAIADARPSMLRAAVMACIYSFALLLRRRGNSINTLALAALLLLTINPLSLFDIGFQLSFVAVTGIVLFTPALLQLSRTLAPTWLNQSPPLTPPTDASAIALPDRHTIPWRHRAIQSCVLLCCVSIAAWLSTLPIVAIHFARVTPMGWLVSIIAFPFVFCVMTLSFLKLGLGLVLPVAGSWLSIPLNLMTDALRGVLETTHGLFGAPLGVSTPTVVAVLAYYACLVAFAFHVRRGPNARGIRWILALAGIATVSWCWPATRTQGLTITQLAVGRGTATLIELPNDNPWLYDAGSSSTSDPGEHILLPLLQDRGITRLSGVIITHANLDHFGGIPSILRRKPCRTVHINTPESPDPGLRNTPFDELIGTLKESGQEIRPLHASDTLNWGPSVSVEVLWPPKDAATHLSANDQSIVIRVEYESHSILMTGDIGFLPQKWLLENCNLKSDVLILPHHGAVEENTAAFIQAVNPDHLVRSSFTKNEESATLQQATGGIPISNTANDGAIEISIRDGQLSILPFRETKPTN